MGFDWGRTALGIGTLGVSEIPRFLSGSDAANDRADKFEKDLAGQRWGAKQNQYQLLEQMKAPSISPQMLARIKALEDESASGPLVSDPLFQGDRATLVQGGQQALSGVQNLQRANDNSGGFSNQGSIADVYDRLGTQLSQLGQHSRGVKEQKRDVAAAARQQIVDGQINYENAITQAKMAIEAGDAASASAALQAAYAARENIANAERQMIGQMMAIGGQVGSAAVGKPPTPAAPVPQYGQQPTQVDPLGTTGPRGSQALTYNFGSRPYSYSRL